jgi:hypothetical protein
LTSRILVSFFSGLAILAVSMYDSGKSRPYNYLQAQAIRESSAGKGTLDVAGMTCSGAPTDCSDFVITAQKNPAENQQPCTHRLFIASIGMPYGQLTSPIGPLYHYSFARQNTLFRPRRFKLSSSPSWSHSATWNLDGTAIMASDVTTKSIYHFSFKSGLTRQIITSSLEENSVFTPQQLQTLDNGYIVENTQGNLLALDEEYTIRSQIYLIDARESLADFIPPYSPYPP